MDNKSIMNEDQIKIKIEKLEWLLKECIGIEEYELCHQIQSVIQREYQKIEHPNLIKNEK